LITPALRLSGTVMVNKGSKKNEVLLSLGSNQGDSLDYLLTALVELDRRGLEITDVSSVYRTAPVGFAEQADFLNMAASASTLAAPHQTLEVCLAVEEKLGRVRDRRWGPRTIDIDILFYNNIELCDNTLQIPHPRLKERAFVLIPLREIDPVKFEELKLFLPEQKVCLQISRADVKMALQEKGVRFGCGITGTV